MLQGEALHGGWIRRGNHAGAGRGRGAAGHDLRQPLQIITSAQDTLARTLHNNKQREKLVQAEDAARQLANMLGQLVEAPQAA